MASSSTSFLLLFLFVAVTAAVYKEFQVGDAVGWRIPAANETELYNVWASRRRFHIGDSLRFRYSADSVAVVDKWGFYHCNSSNPIAFFNDGNSVINLDKVGTMYFVSGKSDRCNKGQRMIVEVMNVRPVFQHPPSIATPPYNPYDAASPAPSQLSTPATKPDSASAVAVSASIVAFVAGLAGFGLCLLTV